MLKKLFAIVADGRLKALEPGRLFWSSCCMAFKSRFRTTPRPLWRKLLDLGLAATLIAGIAFVAARFERFSGEEITGPARVVDGDSLAIGDRRLRLKGIDAPELKQRCRREGLEYGCGLEAASHLRGLVGGSEVACRTEGTDRYGRDLVRCVAGGVELNESMVRSGHAVSFGDYTAAESIARGERAGLWSGEFDRPRDWRAVHGGLEEDLHAGLSALAAFLRRLFGV